MGNELMMSVPDTLLRDSTQRTPNIIHFVCVSDTKKDIPLIYYIACKSAKLINPQYRIIFHYNIEPSGMYYSLIQTFVETRCIEAPESIFGHPISLIQHKVDVLRLQLMIEFGGIYLDLDTICLKSFDVFLEGKVVLGREGDDGLCNAVIIAPRHSEFLTLWYETYQNFHNDQWNEFSVIAPMRLAKLRPDLIDIQPQASFFSPDFQPSSLNDLFVATKQFPDAYIFHLWNFVAKDHINKLNIKSIFECDSTYNLAARAVIGVDRTEILNKASKIPTKKLRLTEEMVIEKQIFTKVYQSSEWGNGSGNGSHPSSTVEYRSFVERFISMNSVSSIIDVGCGDWQSSRFMSFGRAKYIGFDLVEFLVDRNNKEFGSDYVEFKKMPDDPEDLPQADLLIMKDVLQHLSNDYITFFRDYVFPRYKFCLITNSWKAINYGHNQEINAGMFRSLDLTAEPYLFKGAYVVETWNEWERIRTMLLQNPG